MQAHDTQYYTHTTWEYVPSTQCEGTKMVPHYIHHTHDARAQRRNNAYLSQAVRSPYWDSQYVGEVEVPDIWYIPGTYRITKTPSMKIRKGNSKPKSKK